MNKFRWTAAALLAWISTDLYMGKKAHQKKAEDFVPPEVTSGEAEFFMHGDTLFSHMLKRLRASDCHIYMHFYIFRDDNLGSEILTTLIQKAEEGVKVKLMIDWAGARISLQTRRRLKRSGVELVYSQKPKLPFLFYSINERNHRKVTVIDGEHAYVGGFNVGDEYTGNDPVIGSWRDYHLYVRGIAVAALGRQFARDWNAACGEKLDITMPSFRPETEIPIQLLSTDGDHVPNHFKAIFKRAEHSVFIGTPYYIPGADMHREVLKLARRGVKVRIMIPKNPDHPLVKDAAYPYMPELLDAGVEIRQFEDGFFHAKFILIDDKIFDIGTANFDMRSFYINHEVNCIIEDEAWIRNVMSRIERDFFTYGELITYETLAARTRWERTRTSVANLFSSWL
ncbi:cardiolipin synthase [Alkalicoccus halolimnae]|uniref:Cardiolipin synthase n=1 Tax=Alkalicoccus halolimnae TaxID=1667239 RepID=A0A5C7FLD4_9BACI|nr:cardiolipin synthase [Alkalicoccus halolimnae]TXF86919.1 cardiolipin synthase [Alkalicoccus halolimnae]